MGRDNFIKLFIANILENSNQIFGGIFEAYLFKNIDLNAGVLIHYWEPSDQKNKLESK